MRLFNTYTTVQAELCALGTLFKDMTLDLFNTAAYAAVPFHFWSVVFFVFGSMVGSFLNVCIYRMPLGQSIVSPPSHCPSCKKEIPWYRNIPLVTWTIQRGRCAGCGLPISPRYILVELLTGVLFLLTWLQHGDVSVLLVLCYITMIAGMVAATFIDLEHFIIPDEITLGGTVVGILFSLLVPGLHETTIRSQALVQSFIGAAFGAGLIYMILRLGKLMFGKQRLEIDEELPIQFKETSLQLPDREIPYEDIFYRASDTIRIQAKSVRLILKDLSGALPPKTFEGVSLSLQPSKLTINDEVFNPEEIHDLEVMASEVVLPREAMGLGDVKFMAAIGAFLGWKAIIFVLMASSVLGSIVGISAILARKQEWSGRIPYGPYLAMAALIWIMVGDTLLRWWLPSHL